MNGDAFWKLIERIRRADDPEEALRRSLARFATATIAAFAEQLQRHVDEARTWDLWGAAYLLSGDRDEQAFVDFRYGLIAQGRVVFDRALVDPDSLATTNVVPFAELGNVAQLLEGARTRSRGEPRRSKPKGHAWNFDDAAIARKRLPAIARGAARALFDERHLEGWHRTQRGDRVGANALYRRALARHLDDDGYEGVALVYANLMTNAEALGQEKLARRYFDAASKRRENVQRPTQRALVNNQLAWFVCEHGRDDELEDALAWAREGVKRATNPLHVMDTEMRILLRLGREAAARTIAVRALAMNPAHPDFQDVKRRFGLGRKRR